MQNQEVTSSGTRTIPTKPESSAHRDRNRRKPFKGSSTPFTRLNRCSETIDARVKEISPHTVAKLTS